MAYPYEDTFPTSDDDQDFQEIIKAMNVLELNKEISESKFQELPDNVQEAFLDQHRKQKIDEYRRAQRKQQEQIFKTNRKVRHEDNVLRRIMNKIQNEEELDDWERNFFEKAQKPLQENYENDDESEEEEDLDDFEGEIAIIEKPLTEVLDDTVKGRSTLNEIHEAREGKEAADAKLPEENSPLQLFDNTIEEAMDRTRRVLNISEPGQFFDACVYSQNEVMSPEQLQSSLEHASTALELALQDPIVNNDAKQAIDSLIISISLNEAEEKLKKTQDFAIATNEERERMAQIAAVSGAFSVAGTVNTTTTDPSTANVTSFNATQASLDATSDPAQSPSDQDIPKPKLQQPQNDNSARGFNITDLRYDISFLPSNDPNIYKPLEIVSYMGMTNNVPI